MKLIRITSDDHWKEYFTTKSEFEQASSDFWLYHTRKTKNRAKDFKPRPYEMNEITQKYLAYWNHPLIYGDYSIASKQYTSNK